MAKGFVKRQFKYELSDKLVKELCALVNIEPKGCTEFTLTLLPSLPTIAVIDATVLIEIETAELSLEGELTPHG